MFCNMLFNCWLCWNSLMICKCSTHLPLDMCLNIRQWGPELFLFIPTTFSMSVRQHCLKSPVTNHNEPLGSTPIDFLRHLTDITLTLMWGFHILNSYGARHNLLYKWLGSLLGPPEVWTQAITLPSWVRNMKRSILSPPSSWMFTKLSPSFTEPTFASPPESNTPITSCVSWLNNRTSNCLVFHNYVKAVTSN